MSDETDGLFGSKLGTNERRERETHRNPFSNVENLGVKRVDILPLLYYVEGTSCHFPNRHNTLPVQHVTDPTFSTGPSPWIRKITYLPQVVFINN